MQEREKLIKQVSSIFSDSRMKGLGISNASAQIVDEMILPLLKQIEELQKASKSSGKGKGNDSKK